MSQFNPLCYREQLLTLAKNNNKIFQSKELCRLLGYSTGYRSITDIWAFKKGFIKKISYGKYQIDMGELQIISNSEQNNNPSTKGKKEDVSPKIEKEKQWN